MQSSQLYRSSQVVVPVSPLLKMARQANRINRIEFNLSRGNYRDLIQQIRNIVQQPGRYSHNHPVLPNHYDEPPQDWVDVVLSTDTTTITLRIRQDNLYLVGYQLPCGQWLEFGIENVTVQLIPDSAFLGFTGGYTALASVGDRYIEGTQVSRAGVIAAVNELANTVQRMLRARDLALMIMVICEATRFEEMARRFANVMQSGSTTIETIELWMVRLFRGWADLSGRLIRADADGDNYFQLPSDSPLRQRILSALDAASYVGLLLGPLCLRPKGNFGAIAESTNGSAFYVPRGQPMMDVLEVHIADFSGDVSGTITVTDGLGPQTLLSGQQTVRGGDSLALNPLNRALSAWQSIVINFNLILAQAMYSGSYSWDIFQIKDKYSEDSSVSKRSVRLTKYSSTPRLSGRSRDDTANMTIWMCYGLFREAWQVIWEVKITAGDGYDPMNVYGSVTVSYSDGAYSYIIKLFSRGSSDNVVVYVGGCVPLTRKATAVPLDVDVKVDIDLWDYIHVFPDRCIARGCLKARFGSSTTNCGRQNVGGALSHVMKLGGDSNSGSQVCVTAICNRLSAD